jgi:hypothetical protein
MAEWRTAEQVTADEALHRAITDVLRAYTDDPESHDKFMLSEYIVVTARVGMTDDKAQNTLYDYQLSNGSLPWHNMMGLIDWARMTMVEQMRTNAGEDS